VFHRDPPPVLISLPQLGHKKMTVLDDRTTDEVATLQT
jgi:hypothetical protein